MELHRGAHSRPGNRRVHRRDRPHRRNPGRLAATLAPVRATVVAIENQLALLRLTGSTTADSTAAARLTVLGADRRRWQVTDEHGQLRASTLTDRHADILVLLSRHPEGLIADHLAPC